MSEIHKVLGRPVMGWEMQLYGLPMLNIAGLFNDYDYPGSVDLMLAAAQAYPDLIHPTSRRRDLSIVNKYEENAIYYQLRLGNPDPEIVIKNEFSKDDYPSGEFKEFISLSREDVSSELSFAQQKLLEWPWQRRKMLE